MVGSGGSVQATDGKFEFFRCHDLEDVADVRREFKFFNRGGGQDVQVSPGHNTQNRALSFYYYSYNIILKYYNSNIYIDYYYNTPAYYYLIIY